MEIIRRHGGILFVLCWDLLFGSAFILSVISHADVVLVYDLGVWIMVLGGKARQHFYVHCCAGMEGCLLLPEARARRSFPCLLFVSIT